MEFLSSQPALKDCTCDPYNKCFEPGKISWDNCPEATFLHIRFDGCICINSLNKRCDCIIFRFGLNNPIMFAIEVKEGNPDITEVRNKIQYCVDTMINFLPNPKNQFVIIPVLCAQDFSGLKNRAFLSYRIKVFGEKTLIRKRFHGQDINSL